MERQKITVSVLDDNVFFALGLIGVLEHCFALGSEIVVLDAKNAWRADYVFITIAVGKLLVFTKKTTTILLDGNRVLFNDCTARNSLFYFSGHVATREKADFLYVALRHILQGHYDVKKIHRDDFPEWQVLSPRESQVMECLARARRIKEIAGELNITTKTVGQHKKNAMRKLGIKRHHELCRWLRHYKLFIGEGKPREHSYDKAELFLQSVGFPVPFGAESNAVERV